MKRPEHPPSRPARGFALVVTLSLMILVSLIAVGMLSLSAITLRGAGANAARSTAMANARLGLLMAIDQLQRHAGDDRRITADAAILDSSNNPAAVGVWDAWSPDLTARSRPGSASVDYAKPKSQEGFRGWLVSGSDPVATRQLDWHTTEPGSAGTTVPLFTSETSGFELDGGRIPLSAQTEKGTIAWAVSQENTKARINIGTDDEKRINPDDRLQAPSRPSLALSSSLQQPPDDWTPRPATISSLSQAALDPAYGASARTLAQAAADYTTDSASLLTNPVKGGLKVDLTTGFDLPDDEFAADQWDDLKNPFRSDTERYYKGEKPLWTPLARNSQVEIYMDFDPASINHKFEVNGVPTFDTLRAHYRTYRHLYESSAGGTTAFERPYSHISTPSRVTGRPFGQKTHPALAPVLDRVNIVFSIYAKSDGTLGILLTPLVTIWNPHNVDIETEGLVIYPWIDFAVFWNWNVSPRTGGGNQTWGTSLSRFVGEGYQGHGRSSRPYFYLHLTASGDPVTGRAKTITPAIHLEPGEVRVFCLADTSRRDLEILGRAPERTWRMRPVDRPSDITSSLKGGIVLNMTKSIGGGSNFNYKLKPGDRVNANRVEFDRDTYYYIVNMADSYQIKNPTAELMVESRPAYGSIPALREERNLVFYGQVHSHRAFGKGRDSLSYPSYRFEEIRENPQMVGSLLTYHRVAQSGTLPLADLMFTTNPRQPYINQYLSGGRFQTGPHYESLFQGGTTLAQLAMQTTFDGRKAYYGSSHSAASGRSNLAFFEIPRSPTLSLASFQHCDITATAFGCASQIANSWASPYLPANSVSKLERNAPNGERITPSGLAVYDASYLANEALFDDCYLSGAAPRFGSPKPAEGDTSIWDDDQITEEMSSDEVLAGFFADPAANPLRNPRMIPYRGGLSKAQLEERLDGPAKCLRLAAHLMVEGGFNINSTSVEAWTAVLASLRGVEPAAGDMTAQSRFRHIETGEPVNMAENDPWSGFRTLTDEEVKTLATQLITEIKERGPFLSLGEFVNRRVDSDRRLGLSGALQGAIDSSDLNSKFRYSRFATTPYPNPENIPNPNTGTNTPGWLSQADVLHGLAPYITPRSDTFVIRSLGEAKDAAGRVIASVRLEAVVQRVPDWIDPADDAASAISDLKSEANKTFGRRFKIRSVRELRLDPTNNPV